MLRLIYLLITLTPALAGRASETCIKGCSNWSIGLGHCRGQFGPNPYQTNITFATGFLECLCDGSQDDDVIGKEEMRNSVETCSNCVTTPDLIVKDLSVFMGLCASLAESGRAEGVMTFSPIGYSVVEYDGNGKAIKSSPKGTLA